MRIVDSMKLAQATIAVCQGNDILPKMRIGRFKIGGVVFEAGRCEVRNSISDHLQMFIEVMNADSVPIGEMESYVIS